VEDGAVGRRLDFGGEASSEWWRLDEVVVVVVSEGGGGNRVSFWSPL
jgi:hypothetical protein